MCEVIIFFMGAVIAALLLWVVVLDDKVDQLNTTVRQSPPGDSLK